MDVPRAPTPKRRRYLQAGAVLGAVVLVPLGLASLEGPVPVVDRESVAVDSVRRGVMVREVRGPGTLVPEQIRWISALTPARVLAVANPRSSWQWTEMTAFSMPGVWVAMPAISSPNSPGVV